MKTARTGASRGSMTPSRALDRLKAGNARFVSGATVRRDLGAKVVAPARGLVPSAAVLACMDSRAPIEIVFDQTIGDVFVIRVAGNVVNDDVLASLEFAVKTGTRLIVVLGHTDCGAVKGAIDRLELGHLGGLLAKIRPAVEAAACSDATDHACVTKVAAKNVAQSMRQIGERSPYLAAYLDAGEVRVAGAMYDVATGRVTFLENRRPAPRRAAPRSRRAPRAGFRRRGRRR
jgi:carbonic anhydrase